MRLAGITLLSISLWAGAGPDSGAAREQSEAVQARRRKEETQARLLEGKEAPLLEELQKMDVELSEKEISAAKNTAEIERLKKLVPELDAKLEGSELALKAEIASAASRAAGARLLRRARSSDLFTSLSSPIAARKMRDRLALVIAHDAEVISSTHEAQERMRNLRREAATTKALLARESEALRQEIEDARKLRENRAAQLDGIRRERMKSQQLASELALAAERLEKEMGTLRGEGPVPESASGGFGSQRGRLPWPAVGRVEATFGKRVDPASGAVLLQKGLDIRAELGAPVSAVFDGTAAFVGWLAGFGRVVILTHDGGFYTLYAHLSSVVVQNNTLVHKADRLGTVGDTGSVKGPYLYFELRHGREAIDPMAWLTR